MGLLVGIDEDTRFARVLFGIGLEDVRCERLGVETDLSDRMESLA